MISRRLNRGDGERNDPEASDATLDLSESFLKISNSSRLGQGNNHGTYTRVRSRRGRRICPLK
jgi:hypothetical protein